MKSITIAGNVGKDATTRTTGQGDKVTGFPVGVSEGFGDKKRTVWFDVSMWGKRGEKIADYVTKGTKVCVSGDLSTREHEGKTYLTVNASEVTLMGGNERREGDGMSSQARTADRAQRPARDDLEDLVPF